ncbi:MAG TPA: metal-dependent hydrolase [Arenicellales bacterium]|nr:metal-dependent hydrolase [Arenicellales bacterium]
MDSLTQIALGAAVGEAAGGRRFGRRAMLWGALCGTFPDLDTFIPLGDAVKDFTYHRAASHSLFVLAALTPLFVWLITRLHPGTRDHGGRWALLVYLVFATHVLLDSFTVYGTQIFWPLWTTPMTWSTIFIIDPLYTLPLLIGVIAALAAGRGRTWGRAANTVGLALSTTYLAWTLGAKLHVEQVAHRALAEQDIAASSVLTTPAPFNTILWRVLAVDEKQYFEGFYSLLDDTAEVRFTPRPRNLELIYREPLWSSWPVRRLRWFTKDFYAVETHGEGIAMTDLRMGVDPDYVFSFQVGRLANPHPEPAPVERMPAERNWSRLPEIWARIWARPSP